MPETLMPEDIQRELARRMPRLSRVQIEELTRVFLELAGGKYITGKLWAKRRRNGAIRMLFDGKNLLQLARQFHLTTRQVRRVVEK